MHLLLDIRILDVPFLATVYALSCLTLTYLILRRPLRVRLPVAAASGAIGAVTGLLIGWLVGDVWDVFGVGLTAVTRMWVCLFLAGTAIAVTNLRGSRWVRKAIAALAIVLFATTGAAGINADFGMFTTVRSALGLEAFAVIKPPKVVSSPTPGDQPLWAAWAPPASLPNKGEVGTVVIPATRSGFVARDALVYLPPAALVPNPPKLPVLIMLSGQPGAPYNIFDSLRLADLLDSYSRSHAGLAPIVVVPDQLGAADRNPMCVDAQLGNSATYITVDVRNWIVGHFNVESDPHYWAIGGYSQGGTCSIQFGAGHPELFGSIIDAAGELAPHVGSKQNTIDQGFGGSAAAYTAATPLALLAQHAPYPDSIAVFGIGQNDPRFTPGQSQLAQAARTAGMKVTFVTSPGSAHDWRTVRYTLERALPILYAHWGLSGE